MKKVLVAVCVVAIGTVVGVVAAMVACIESMNYPAGSCYYQED